MSAKCKTCGAPILWTKTKAGKPMPVDAESVPDGNVYVVRVGVALHSFSKADVGLQQATRHTSHFATCADAAERRKPKAPPVPSILDSLDGEG